LTRILWTGFTNVIQLGLMYQADTWEMHAFLGCFFNYVQFHRKFPEFRNIHKFHGSHQPLFH